MNTIKKLSRLLVLTITLASVVSANGFAESPYNCQFIIKKDSSFYSGPLYLNQLYPLTRFEPKLIVFNENNIAEFKEEIHEATIVEITFTNQPYMESNSDRINITSGYRFFLEPGDSIVVCASNANYIPKLEVTGKGAEKFQYLLKNNTVYDFTQPNPFKLPIKEALNLVDKQSSDKLKEFTKIDDQFSHEFIRYVKTQIKFSNINKKHRLIRAHINSLSLAPHLARAEARKLYSFMDSIDINNPAYLISDEYRGVFLTFYLEYINRITTGEDRTPKSSEAYQMANLVYKGETRKFYLFNVLLNEIFFGDILEIASLYFDYFNEFDSTPMGQYIWKRRLEKYNRLPGKKAPNTTLIDLNNRKFNLKDLRGNVVYLSVSRNSFTVSKDQQQVLKDELAIHDKTIAIIFSRFIENTVSTDKFRIIDEIKNNEAYHKYTFHSYINPTYLIGKDGTIRYVYNTSPGFDELHKRLSELENEPYNLFTRTRSFAKQNSENLFITFFLLALLATIIAYFNIRNRRQSEMQKSKLNSELKAIRAQLNPHFLFNSLTSIQNFINKADTEAANRHLSQFATLMRKILDFSKFEKISLQEELDTMNTYLELEALRHRFVHTIQVDENVQTNDIDIPPMLLQPFIENAVLHGVSKLGSNGQISISVQTGINNKMKIEIRDNGSGFDEEKFKPGEGIRLSTERISLLNTTGKDYIRCSIYNREDVNEPHGTLISFEINCE